jgi:hypothetical protein
MMSASHKRSEEDQDRRIALAVASAILVVIAAALPGAWSEARWPNSAGRHITVNSTGPAGTADVLWRLRQIDGVARAVAVLRGELLPDEIERTGWREVNLYANQADAADLAFLPPDPTLRLYRGRLPAADDPDDVVVGYELAEALHLRVGDRTTIRQHSFNVAGIWSPSARLPGNFVQVSAAAAEPFILSLKLDHFTIIPATGLETTEVAHRIWQRMPDVQVLAPDWELAQTRRERTVLGLAVSGALLLVLLLGAPLWAHLPSLHETPAAVSALVSGIAGLLVGWAIVLVINSYCRRTLGLTPLLMTPRLAAGLVTLAASLGLFARRSGAHWQWPAHYVVTALVLVLCTAAQVAVGTLHESLRLSLGEAQRTAADWVTLRGAPADAALVRDVARLPGIRGYVIEAYGGPADLDEERKIGPVPALGVFYGLLVAGGEGALSVPYRLGYWQGRPLQADALHEAVIGYDLAQEQALRVGDNITIRDAAFSIVGIRTRLAYDPANGANHRIDISLEALRTVLYGSLASAELTLLIPPASSQEDKAAFLQEVGNRVNAEPFTIEDRLAEMAGSYPAAWTITPSTPQTSVRHATGLYTGFRILINVLLLAASALAVAGAMVYRLAADEPRISLLKALGASESQLLGQYVQMAAVLGVMGALPGLLGGCAVSALLNRLGPAGSAELLFTPQLAAAAFFFTVLTAMVAAVGPVVRAIRQDATATLYASSLTDNHVLSPATAGGLPGGSEP